MNVNILTLSPVLSDVKNCIQYMRGRNLLLNDYISCNVRASKVMDVHLKTNRFSSATLIISAIQLE